MSHRPQPEPPEGDEDDPDEDADLAAAEVRGLGQRDHADGDEEPGEDAVDGAYQA